MKRILFALLTALFLCSCAVSFAEEPAEVPEEPLSVPLPVLATATDFCVHEHTHKDYYFDAPVYHPLDAEVHTVTGRATVQVFCDDCGTVLSSVVERDAQTTFPHVFRRGQCLLCGYESGQKKPSAREASTELILLLPADEETPNQFFCTLTGQDLESQADTLVLRPEGCETAIALQTRRLREEIDSTGGTITAEIESPGEGDVTASVRLYTAEGEESSPYAEELSLRIYNDYEGETLTVSYTGPEGETAEEEASRITPEAAEAYWSVSWLGDGNYTY